MDSFDRKIIRELQQNGRITNQKLSDTIGLSPSPCLKRLRDLESSGVLLGYTAQVDQVAYGLPITAFVRVRLSDHNEETVASFEARIGEIERVQDCYLIAGEADYLLRIVIEDFNTYEEFIRRRIQRLTGVASIDTSFAYGVVKRSTVFPPVGHIGR